MEATLDPESCLYCYDVLEVGDPNLCNFPSTVACESNKRVGSYLITRFFMIFEGSSYPFMRRKENAKFQFQVKIHREWKNILKNPYVYETRYF